MTIQANLVGLDQPLIVVTVGSTSFKALIESVLDSKFFNSIDRLISSLRSSAGIEEPGKISFIVQVGNVNLDLSDQLIPSFNFKDNLDHHPLTRIEIDRFNQDQSHHLNLTYSHPPPPKLDHPILNQISILIFKFSSSIDRLLSSADLVITHAGAGSILSAIKPIEFRGDRERDHEDLNDRDARGMESIEITPGFSIPITQEYGSKGTPRLFDKRVIIVPNHSLMDDHQIDLAHEISNLGLAHSCQPDELIDTLLKIEKEIKLDGDHHHPRTSSPSIQRPDSPTKPSKLNRNHSNPSNNKFKDLLDQQIHHFWLQQ